MSKKERIKGGVGKDYIELKLAKMSREKPQDRWLEFVHAVSKIKHTTASDWARDMSEVAFFHGLIKRKGLKLPQSLMTKLMEDLEIHYGDINAGSSRTSRSHTNHLHWHR